MDGLFDRLPESGTTAAMSSQQPRAARVSDAKWNEWRMDLERLYLEKEAPQKDIIDFIWIEHGVVIT